MKVNKLKDFIFEKYYRQTGFSKENSYYSMKHQKEEIFKLREKIPDPSNAK